MSELRNRGIDPFGSSYEVTSNSKEIKDLYDSYTIEELEEKNVDVSIAGRIMTKRGKGKAGFMNIQDKFGQIQVYVKLDNVGEDQWLGSRADVHP
jgi:lysyl-tRNA synthetase class 2